MGITNYVNPMPLLSGLQRSDGECSVQSLWQYYWCTASHTGLAGPDLTELQVQRFFFIFLVRKIFFFFLCMSNILNEFPVHGVS